MSEKVVVFRVSNWFFDRINEYCKAEGISYVELFSRAIKRLREKYLEEEVSHDERADRGKEDRN
jgi:hypothetical protein